VVSDTSVKWGVVLKQTKVRKCRYLHVCGECPYRKAVQFVLYVSRRVRVLIIRYQYTSGGVGRHP
jgi:hypothetical protein